MNKTKNRSHVFWIFYLAFIVFLCAFCITGLTFFHSILEDYESAQPYNVVNKYIEKLKNGDYSYALGFSGFTWTDFAETEECTRILESRYKNKNIYYLESSTHLSSGQIRYNLYSNGERLGYVILELTEAKTKYGFRTWKITSCEPFEFLGTYTVTVPKGYTLYADGKPVGGNYISEISITEEYPVINGKEQPSNVSYKLHGFITEPEFTVDPIYGEEYTKTVSADGTETTFERKPVCYHEIFGFLRSAMEEYINAISLKGDMENYLNCVLEGSHYANVVKDFNSAWIMYQPEFESTAVENFEILKYEEYTATQVIAEISFDYKVYLKYSSETYPSKYRIICTHTENGWKIANMENS